MSYSGKTAAYKALIGAMKAVLKESEEATEKQKETILSLLGPVAGHISCPACCDSESESDSDNSSSDESESDSEESGSEESDSESEGGESESECDGDNCTSKRKYRRGARSKGRSLYKKNGGTEEKWRTKSDKFKDSYYEKYKGRNVEVA